MVLYVLQAAFYRKLQENVRFGDNVTQNAECTLDAKKLMNQKNYIMKHKKITKMEVRADKERNARKSEKSPRRKRGRKARTLRHYKG
jgi:hypothetical protein